MFFTLVLIGMLLAFNLFAADTMIRMRTDVQIIRKALADPRKDPRKEVPVPVPSKSKTGKSSTSGSSVASVASSGRSTPRRAPSSKQQKGGVAAGGLKDALSAIKKLGGAR